MTILVIAEHDNASIKAATLNTVAAAQNGLSFPEDIQGEADTRRNIVFVARHTHGLRNGRIGKLWSRCLLIFIPQAHGYAESRCELPLVLDETCVIGGLKLKAQGSEPLLIAGVVRRL